MSNTSRINWKRVGKEIKRLRTSHNLTQSELADTLAIDSTYVSHLENGKRACSFRILERIAAAFEVSYQSLLDSKEE